MDCTCNCFGVATAARVPVKRYNLLVPDVFPVVEPSFDRPLGITIERKIKKLADYLEKNEFRSPKVSRRLQRRLYKELGAGNFGYVKLAVQTYSYLLAHNKPEKSNMLANELVVRTVVKRRKFVVAGPKDFIHFREPHQGSAVGLLLIHPLPQLRKLGVDLLIDFIKCQQTSDYVPQLEAFVPLLCNNASPRVAAPSEATSAAAATSGNAAAAAEATITADHWAALRASCLRALLEHLRFCARLSYVSYHLHTITFMVLACVDASGHGAPRGVYLSPRAMLEGAAGKGQQRVLDTSFSITRCSISHVVAASPPAVAALLVFEELAHMTRDAAEGKKVLEFVMRYLDDHHRWMDTPVLEISMAVLQAACEQEHQRYLLFSSLLRHVTAAQRLAPAERAAVLRLALHESWQLEQALAAPALLLALRELPAVIASHSAPGTAVPPMPLPAMPRVAPLGAVSPGQQEVELAAVAAGQQAAPSSPVNLQLQVLAAVEQLARRVEDSGQLMEAVSSTVSKLRGVAPISTAALQCCVAAGQAIQFASPKASRGSAGMPRTFPSLLAHELAGIAVGWEPQQRLLAHQLLLQLLPAAADGLKEQQAAVLLSTVWHETALQTSPPAVFVALDQTLRALLGAAPATALPQVLKLAAALQLDVLQADDTFAGGRLAQLSAAQLCAVLCVCSSTLQALAAQLGSQSLQELAAPGCEGVLQQLAVVPPHGLLLRGLAIDGGLDSASAEAASQQQLFWQGPAVELAFSTEAQQRAASFLADWRSATTAAQQEAAVVAALTAVPLFKQQGSVAAGLFQPMPLASLTPRLMTGNGPYTGNGSSASEGNSKRVQRLRSMYRHMRQISLCDADRTALATISQESATEEPAVAMLQMRGLVLPWVVGSGGEGGTMEGAADAAPTAKSADDVLAEVDAALAAAEEAIERGRRPSPAAWYSVAGDSSGSASGRNGGGGSVPLHLLPNGSLLRA